MAGSYDSRLVFLSVLISIAASYAALDLAGRVTSARGRGRLLWLCGGASAMGMGIWSMHYIGVLDADIAFLQKPFSLDRLLVKVRETLDTWR